MTVSHTFTEAGEYMVALTVMDSYGGNSTISIPITVTNVAPWIIETDFNGLLYPGTSIQFEVTADDTPGDVPSLEYTWDFGDGNSASGRNVVYSYAKAGTYSVEVTVTDDDGAADSAQFQIIITDPFIAASMSSEEILQDETVTFNAFHELDDGSFIYTWHFCDGSTMQGTNVTHIYTQARTFTPWLTVFDGSGDTTLFLPDVTVRNVIPAAAVQADKLQVVEDEAVHFDASGSWDSPSDLPILSYSWDFGDGKVGFGMDVSHAFSGMGNYTVVLTVSDGKATSTSEVEVEVQNVPPIADAGIPKERKATVGKAIILDASGTTDTPSDMAGLNFTWRIGNDTVYGEVVSYTFVSTGEFTVTLTVRDNNGAVSEDTLTFEVSKSSESEDEETMSALGWILVVIMVVLLVVIGFLLSKVRDEALYKEMIAEREAEEAIEVEGVIDEASFKPQDDVQEITNDVGVEQDGAIAEGEE